MLTHIVEATVNQIDAANFGGITLLEQGKVRAVAATDDMVRRLDETQNALAEGPCLSSLREHTTMRADDLALEKRWPTFCAAAVDEGVQSMLSVQLFVEGDNLGALNLYAGPADALSLADEDIAIASAAHAAVAMKSSRVEANLNVALQSQDVIGQAKGVLMERFRIDERAAFDLLVLSSQRTNRKLRDVAEHLAATGALRVD